MAKFKVGDVCILINSVNYPELNGVEVTIIEGIRTYRNVRTGELDQGYKTDLVHDGVRISPKENQLKPLPPKDQVVSWSDCVWQPEGVMA